LPAIRGFRADGPDLLVETAQGPLRLTMGEVEAQRWVAALAKAPPGLAEKLGLREDRRVYPLTPLTDEALIAATAPYPAPAADAASLLAELPDEATLTALLPQLGLRPALPFWAVTVKGKSSPFGENALRGRMRAAGYMDVKTCAVSPLRTATRYHFRAPPDAAALLS
jgi:hypothetical protein